MLRRSIVSLALLASIGLHGVAQAKQPAPLAAPAGTYVLEKTHASLGMSNYTARFKNFDARVQYDPKNLARSSVEASSSSPEGAAHEPSPE